MKKYSKKEQFYYNAACVSAIITQNLFAYLIDNLKNTFSTFAFISEMSVAFMNHCETHKYVIGVDPIKDKEGILNWCVDVLTEHPAFKDNVAETKVK